MQLRAAISFLSLWDQFKPQNGHFFPPNSRQNRAFYTINCFSDAPTGSEVLLWGAVAQTEDQHFFEPLGTPKMGFFHLMDKIADFLHNKLFF